MMQTKSINTLLPSRRAVLPDHIIADDQAVQDVQMDQLVPDLVCKVLKKKRSGIRVFAYQKKILKLWKNGKVAYLEPEESNQTSQANNKEKELGDCITQVTYHPEHKSKRKVCIKYTLKPNEKDWEKQEVHLVFNTFPDLAKALTIISLWKVPGTDDCVF